MSITSMELPAKQASGDKNLSELISANKELAESLASASKNLLKESLERKKEVEKQAESMGMDVNGDL